MIRSLLKHLIFTLLVVSLLANDGLCGPKKKKTKKPAAPKKVGDTNNAGIPVRTSLRVFIKMRKQEGSCFIDADVLEAYSTEKYVRQIMKTRALVDDKLHSCHETYEKAIETRLEQLGIVGDALREWLYKIDDMVSDDPDILVTIREEKIDLRKINLIKAFFEVNIEEPEGTPQAWIPFGSERPNEDPSSVSEEEKARRFKETLFWRAYHMGTGICTHLKEYPLWSIYYIVSTAQYFSNKHYREDNIDPITYDGKVLDFDEAGRLSMTGRYMALRHMCKHFNQEITARKEEVLGKSPHDAYIDTCAKHANDSMEMFGPNGQFSVFVEDLTCDVKKFYRLRESIRCLVRLEDFGRDIHKELAMLVSLGNRLITGCLESLEDEIEPILKSIMSASAYDEALEEFLGLLGNFMKKTYQVDDQATLEYGMSVRSLDLTGVEVNFFFRDIQFDKFDILQGYLDGTKMCDLFKTPEWKHFMNTPNKLLEFYEVFAEFSRTHKFRLEGYAATHPAMTIYQLATMCRSIEIVPFYVPSDMNPIGNT